MDNPVIEVCLVGCLALWQLFQITPTAAAAAALSLALNSIAKVLLSGFSIVLVSTHTCTNYMFLLLCSCVIVHCRC